MKKNKVYTCITLFSVGLLAIQWVGTPLLLAEERQKMVEVSEHSPSHIEEQQKESDRHSVQEEKGPVPIEEILEQMPEVIEDHTNDLKDREAVMNVSEEPSTDSLDTENGSETTAADEEDVEKTIEEAEEQEETPPDVEKPVEPSPVPDNEQTEEQEEEPSNPSYPFEERTEAGEEAAQVEQETNQEQSVTDKEATPPTSYLPEVAGAPLIQQPNVSPPVTTWLYDGSVTSNLPESFRASEVAESTLLGFTLPQLSTYEEEWQAALVYEVIRQVGETSGEETFESWVNTLFSEIVEEKKWTDGQEETEESLRPGDLIISDTGEIEGLYLAEGYQVHLTDLKEVDASLNEDEAQKNITIQRIDRDERISVKRMDQVSLTAYGQSLVRDYPAPYTFTANQETQTFIDTLATDAQRLGQEYDVFASVLIAQAILESGSGSSGLSRHPYYNLFGIKGSYQGNSVVLPTMEDKGDGDLYEVQSAFRSYASYQESMSDYIGLLRGGITGNTAFYKDVWRSEARNYLRATDALTGTYATDVTYNRKLNSLIAAYGLTKYDQVSGEETGVFIQGEDQIPAEYRALMQFPAYNGRDYNDSGSYPVGQCTWYVFNRVSQLGGTVDEYMGNGGQWGATGRRLGYTVSQTPTAGSMVSFTPGTAGSDSRYGHVAFVEAVGPNGILISEGNVVGGTTISYRVISNELARSSQVSYIIPK